MEKSKRVLLLLPQPFYVDRGGSYRTRATIAALVENGFAVDLVCFGPGVSIEIPGCSIFRTPTIPGLAEIPPGASIRKVLYDLLLALRVLPLILTRRYAAIQGVEEGAFLAGMLGMSLRRPFVMDLHSKLLREFDHASGPRGVWLLRPMRRLVRALFRWSAHHAAGFIGTNPPQQLAAGRPILDIRGLSLGEGMPARPDEVEAVRESCSLRGTTAILYNGGMEAHQGVDLLLRSFAELIRRARPFERSGSADAVPTLQERFRYPAEKLRLVISGTDSSTGEVSGGERLVRARRLALHLGIEDQVTFTGLRAGESFSALTAVADVIVTPRLEGEEIPTKLYSFLHTGKPLVATRIPAHLQVVDESTSYLCEPTLISLSEAMARALSPLPELVAEREGTARRARALAEERYGYGAFCGQLRTLYHHIFEPPRAAGAETRQSPTAPPSERGNARRSELSSAGQRHFLSCPDRADIGTASFTGRCTQLAARLGNRAREVTGFLFSFVPLPIVQESISLQAVL